MNIANVACEHQVFVEEFFCRAQLLGISGLAGGEIAGQPSLVPWISALSNSAIAPMI